MQQSRKSSRPGAGTANLGSLFIGAVLALFSGMANAALIHQYTFDGGSVATDSVGGATGTLFGGASIVGGELSLDGTSGYVETVGNHIVPVSGDFTVSMFARQNAFGGSHVELISQQGGSFYLGYDPNHTFRITDGNLVTNIPFPTDTNYHNYALSVSGTTGTLYIDGVFQGSFGSILRGSGGTDTRFGRQYNGHGEYFNGFIDNVTIWNTPLSSAEIAAIANPVPEPETYAMLMAGLLLIGLAVRRHRHPRYAARLIHTR